MITSIKRLIFVLPLCLCFSCATILGGPITDKQRRKPAPGEPQREVRAWWLVADIIFFIPGTIVDFATGAIYKK